MIKIEVIVQRDSVNLNRNAQVRCGTYAGVATGRESVGDIIRLRDQLGSGEMSFAVSHVARPVTGDVLLSLSELHSPSVCVGGLR